LAEEEGKVNIEVILSAAVGLLSATGASSALVLLLRCEACEMSARAVMAMLVALACGLCFVDSLYLQATVPQALIMLVAAANTLQAILTRRRMVAARDLNPFA
jgi:hypothetical protein